MLGAGSIVPTINRFGSGLYLETTNTKILFDPGPSTIQRLNKINVQPQMLDAVLITHFHLDHLSDLLPLIMLWPYNSDGTPSPNPRQLRVIGPLSLKNFVKQITEVDALQHLVSTMGCDKYLMVEELAGGQRTKVNECTVTAAEVEHYHGLAYRVDFDGKSVVYSGDTTPDQRLINLAKGCDVLIHECSFPHEKLVGKHTSERQLAEIASQIKPKKLVVTHLYPLWRGRENEIIDAVKRSGLDDVVVAEDMLTLEI